MTRFNSRRWVPHPLIIVLLTVPAQLAVLLAQRPWFSITVLACCLLVTVVTKPRFAAVFIAAAGALSLVLWVGMGLWLPLEAATNGALRIVALSALLVVPFFYVNWPVLADSLIDRFRVSYRVMDTVLLGERFTMLMRADLRTARRMARLRARGSIRGQTRLLLRTTLPVLVASFRHSDELALALDTRGFGAHPKRTVHQSRPLRAFELAILIAVWVCSIFIAVFLERM
ncbi:MULTISPECIES: energy-coupling factor transporter transmembrane component T [Actinomycetes]|uniref:Energy-coupling factor transport system permease protein n=2 Tax=Actinomycetes TaxID=1760 RepID=A0A2H1KRW7_BREAU|nr:MULTISPECIES: energy-coupling factor transporter transmembrane component T [Actinomycetes]AHI21394.1 putative cobalt transport protein [Corynebacterium casei LMG S-19264]MDA3146017.1 hypothetical protein [Leucobacter sp. UCMA 4100]MDN6281500.1 energy-coupling factor transporter transmembrane protein EcfT [Corynebacterium sp.]MDN6305020.1 energy-coupling factor transporter transmembrane protein EcfT [Corynebacterium sp.]MDN6366847.1 energy-coupling factor transporter transmembrane protein Ec